MLKTFILLPLLFAVYFSFACGSSVSQNSWRWRNNDGSETSATWKANKATPITYNFNNEVLRLRVEVINSRRGNNGINTCTPLSYTLTSDSLQYSNNIADANSWETIGFNPANVFMLAGINNYVSNGEATTNQITESTSPFSAGKIVLSDSIISNISIQASGHTEIEWAIVGTSNMLPNTTYYFRIHKSGTSPTYIYSTYPSLTTSGILPIKLTSFTVSGEGKKAKLEWTTASEQNNDRFEVQRSMDERMWQSINTVKGRGTTNTATNYFAYDNSPSYGINYYRLLQFDKDGKSTISGMRAIRIASGTIKSFSVFPNPAHDAIRFITPGNVFVNITATLSDASGKIIHQQLFQNLQGGGINTLHLKPAPPGIYTLKLRGKAVSESIKVMIQ